MAAKQTTEQRSLIGDARKIHARNNRITVFSVGPCRGDISGTSLELGIRCAEPGLTEALYMLYIHTYDDM
jgi:hypothetical protein